MIVRNLREELSTRERGEQHVRNILEGLRLPDDNADRIRAKDLPSLRYLFESCLQRPAREVLIPGGGFSPLRMAGDQAVQEAEAGVSWFKQITTQLIQSKLIEGYTAREFIWPALIEEVPEAHRDVKAAGIEGFPEPVEVKRGENYPVVPFASEKYVTGEQVKKGYIVEVDEDVILEDQTGQLYAKARDTGWIMSLDKEERVLNGVQDVNSTVFRPQGSAEALYRTSVGTNSNRINSTTNALVDYTDFDEVLALFAAFKMNRDQTGKIIPIPNELQLLTPSALASTGDRIVTATQVEYDNLTSGVGVRTISGAPHKSRVKSHLSSNLIDAQSTTAWFLGVFKKQFKWFYKWLMRVVEDNMGDRYFTADVILRIRSSEYGEIVATDDCWIVKSTGAS